MTSDPKTSAASHHIILSNYHSGESSKGPESFINLSIQNMFPLESFKNYALYKYKYKYVGYHVSLQQEEEEKQKLKDSQYVWLMCHSFTRNLFSIYILCTVLQENDGGKHLTILPF